MKETITKILMLALILLFVAGILSLSVAIFAVGFVFVAAIGGYLSIRRWWLRKKGVPVHENRWTHAFDQVFTSPRKNEPQEQEDTTTTIIEVEYEEVNEREKDKS